MNSKYINKGFSLIELLGLIVIFGIISSICFYSVINIINDVRSASYETTINNIKDDAINYIVEGIGETLWVASLDEVDREYQCVTVEKLIDAGYFKSDILKSKIDENEFVNLYHNVYLERDKTSKSIVLVNYGDLSKHYCRDYGLLDGNIEVYFDKNYAKTKDILIRYNIYNVDRVTDYKYDYSYVVGGNVVAGEDFKFSSYKEEETVTVNDNGMLYANIVPIVPKEGENSVFYSILIDSLDNEGPEIVFGTNGTENYVKSISSTISVSDKKSAVDDSSLKYSFALGKTGNPNIEFINNSTISKNGGTGSYYLIAEACDKLGNCSKVISKEFKIDNTGPVINFATDGTTSYSKRAGSSVSVSDSHSEVNDTSLKYTYSTSVNAVPSIAFTNDTFLEKKTGTGDYYLIVKACDKLGNCTTKKSKTFKIDNTGPTISLGTNGNSNWAKTVGSKISVSDGQSGINASSLRYIYSLEKSATPNRLFTNDTTVSKTNGTGEYYLIVKACDVLSNCASYTSNVFKLDNTGPDINITSTNNVDTSQTLTATLNDSQSGIYSYYFGTTNPSTNNVTWILTNRKQLTATVTNGGTYYFGVKDVLGNVSVVSKNFYKTTLSITNGTVSPNYVITMEGNSFTIPNPTNLGNYTFKGWYSNSSFTGDRLTTYNPTRNATLYGSTELLVYNVNIKYNVQGGTVSQGSYNFSSSNSIVYMNGSPLVTKVAYNSSLDRDGLINPDNSTYVNITKSGYHAKNGEEWKCLSNNCKKDYYSDSEVYKGYDFCDASKNDCEVTLGVNWEGNLYTITYVGNGGYSLVASDNDSDGRDQYCEKNSTYYVGGDHDINGTMASQTCRYGETCTLNSNSLTRQCHIFKGWTTKSVNDIYKNDYTGQNFNASTATDSFYSNQDSFTYNIQSNLTLRAVWKSNHDFSAEGETVVDMNGYYEFTCGHSHRYAYNRYCSECHMSVRHYNYCYKQYYEEEEGNRWCPCRERSYVLADAAVINRDNMVRHFGGIIQGNSLMQVVRGSVNYNYCNH